MRVMCILGVGCAGKSTYCDSLLEQYNINRQPRPILLQPGKFFRRTFGPDFFKNLDSPGAPAATESWVRNMVHHAITAGKDYGRDVILDGFPRTPGQFHWLMNSSVVATTSIPVKMFLLQIAEGALDTRISKRKEEYPDEVGLTDERIRKDAGLYANMQVEINCGRSSYPNLTVTNMNV